MSRILIRWLNLRTQRASLLNATAFLILTWLWLVEVREILAPSVLGMGFALAWLVAIYVHAARLLWRVRALERTKDPPQRLVNTLYDTANALPIVGFLPFVVVLIAFD